MKKFLTIALCVLLVSIMFVSCGKKEEVQTSAVVEETAAPETKTETKVAPVAATPAVQSTTSTAAVVDADVIKTADASDKVFRIGNGAEPASIDPHQIEGVPEHRIFEALFEGLVISDPETAEAVPGVAESWDVSADGKQYTFHLRDCNWSDGVPITAEDVVYSWLRGLDPNTASPYAWFPCMFLAGAQEFNSQELTEDGEFTVSPDTVGVRALDDHTFQMDLIGPLPYVLGALEHYSFAIVPEHVINEFGDKWILPENFVGNGPFTLTEWKTQSYIRVDKNPEYWDKDNVALDTVYFYASDDNNTIYNMYLNGELDWITTVPQAMLDSASLRDDYQSAPQLSTYYYVFQTEEPPMNDVNVRKALARAIDRDALVEKVTKGGQIPAWGIVPDMAGYPTLEFPEDNDVESAKAYLAAAGYEDGEGFPEITILYNTSDNHKAIAEFVQSEWKKNLNIDVKLVNMEWDSYLKARREGDFTVARAGWVGDYQDPNTFLDMFITDGDMNGGRYSSAMFDGNIKGAARMPEGDSRMSVLKSAENQLINVDQGILPFYYYTTTNMIDMDVWGGWYTNTMDYHPAKDIFHK